MTYSCAVFETPDDSLETAQEQKYELICRKLGLQPGPATARRRLRLGRHGHARRAQHYGVQAVGVTISPSQADLAAKRVAEAGLADRVDIRLLDYRDVVDGPYDAISSIGMFEHVGLAQLGEYFERLHRLVVPGGRVLNHGISRPWSKGRSRFARVELHRSVRLPRRRAARGRHGRVGDAAARPRGAPRREPARALREDAPPLGREPRGELGRSGAPRRARAGEGVEALHGRVAR